MTTPYNAFGEQTQGMSLGPIDRLKELDPILHLLPAGSFEIVRRLKEGGRVTLDDMLSILRTCHKSLGDMIVALEDVATANLPGRRGGEAGK